MMAICSLKKITKVLLFYKMQSEWQVRYSNHQENTGKSINCGSVIWQQATKELLCREKTHATLHCNVGVTIVTKIANVNDKGQYGTTRKYLLIILSLNKVKDQDHMTYISDGLKYIRKMILNIH